MRDSSAGCLVAALACLAACSHPQAVRQDALENGKIRVSTADEKGTHLTDMAVMILPFTNETGDASLDSMGRTLSDLVSAKLAPRKGFKLVERASMARVMGELKLGQTGAIDQASAIQLGRMLGANVIAFGSYSKMEGVAVLSTRLVKVETGEIIGGAVARGDMDKLDRMAEKTAGELGDSLEGKQ
jgi:TolB-like protein